MTPWHEVVTKWDAREARKEILGAARAFLAACPYDGPITTRILVLGIIVAREGETDPTQYEFVARRIARMLCGMAPVMKEAVRGTPERNKGGFKHTPWLWVTTPRLEKEPWE